MIKAETVEKEGKKGVESVVKGFGGDILKEFSTIVDNLRDNFPEDVLLDTFTCAIVQYDIKHNNTGMKAKLKKILEGMLDDLQQL